jgi:hypothetical protein
MYVLTLHVEQTIANPSIPHLYMDLVTIGKRLLQSYLAYIIEFRFILIYILDRLQTGRKLLHNIINY